MPKTGSRTGKELGALGIGTHDPVGSDMVVPKELRGKRALSTYRKMEFDASIGSFIYYVQMIMRNKQWTVTPFDASDAARADANFLETNIKGMSSPFSSVISEALKMLIYGFSVFEIVYALDNGSVVWRKFAPRAQVSVNRWIKDSEGGLEAMVQEDTEKYREITIPITKLLLFRPEVSLGNPWGVSLLRNAYESWYYGRNMRKIEAIGVERDLAGIPVGRVPSEILSSKAKPDEINLRNEWERSLKQLRRNEQEFILLPSDRDEKGHYEYDLELLKSAGNRQHDLDKVIYRYDAKVLTTLLADFLILGHNSVGTYGLGQNKSDMLLTSMEGIAKSIADVFNEIAVTRLFMLNGNTSQDLPKLEAPEFVSMDLKTLAGFLRTAGVQVDDLETQNILRGKVGLPEVVELKADKLEPEVVEPEVDPKTEEGSESAKEDADELES